MKWRRRKAKPDLIEAAIEAEKSRVELERIKAQWPEVRRVGGAAREHGRANHLTELFNTEFGPGRG